MIFRHLHHSAYEVITKEHQLVFDYFKGDLTLRQDKVKVFFVSHAHSDHYHPRVQSMADILILWKDIPCQGKNCHLLDVQEELKLPGMTIRTSGSTDEGLSFEVEIEGKRLIHAGDLNNWVWPEDSEEERKQMEEDFLHHLSVFQPEPDALMFPVDYRLQEHYDLGVNQAVELLRPKYLFPLHFREYPQILPIYKEFIKDKVRMILPEEMPFELK